MISPVRFFAVAPLHSRYMLMALAAVLVSGLAMLLVDPAKGGDPVAPLILLQMLAASSGFAVGARRGHLDLLLTAGPSRVNIALVHLAASVLPGVLVWLALAATEAAARGTSRPRAFASGTVLAMMAVSILAWALTVPLPRLSGGIAWLLGIAMWVVGWSGGPAVLAAAPAGEGGTALRAVVVTLWPFVLVGHRLTMRDAPAITPLVLLSLFLAIAAVVWIARMDVSLESAQ